MKTKLATWNVNSVRVRLPAVLDWLSCNNPDILLLQETKCTDDVFPRSEFEAAGYHALVHGQKTFNGVAVLSRRPAVEITRVLPGDPADDQARYLEAEIDGLRVVSLYLPNGNPVPGGKFDYKLAWMARLAARAGQLLSCGQPVILGGDYNVCPGDDDIHDPAAWRDDALCRPESRDGFRRLAHLGFIDAFRALHSGRGGYTWWDYQGGAWTRDEGARIDHLMVSPRAADRLVACGVDRAPRGRERASDHAPVWVDLLIDPPVLVSES